MTRANTGTLARVSTIARREIAAMIDQPTGYVLVIVFVAINAFMFFRQAYIAGVGTLRPMFDLLPWLLLFFVPALSMRTLAEDARSGTLEVVLTQPLNEFELLLGKYAGTVLLLCGALLCTLPIPAALSLGTELQWGPILAQYAGGALLAAGLTGIGVWASSVARSQVTAFIVAVAVMFLFIFVGLDPILSGLPPSAAAIAARLGVISHFDNIARGVIDLRDVIYFVSLGGIFLLFAYGIIAGRRLSRRGVVRKRLRAGVALATVGVVVLNLLGGYIGGRLDLTPGGQYTLSRATRDLLRNLDDVVTVKVFASDALPTSVALVQRDLDDMLSDIRAAARGKVLVVKQNTSTDRDAQRDAQALGIVPVQFNVYGSQELQVKEGYLGLSVQYGASSAPLPFVNRTNDLEFRLASAIRQVTRSKKPVLDVIVGSPSNADVTVLRGELAKNYELRDVGFGDVTQPSADVAALLIVGDPDSLAPQTVDRFAEFIRRGGGAVVLANGVDLSLAEPIVTPRTVRLNAFLREFGVTVNSNVVYDLVSNEVIPRQSGPMPVLVRYPYFVRAQSTRTEMVNRDLANALIPWPSSLDTAATIEWRRAPIFVTSKSAGISQKETRVDPANTEYARTGLEQRVVGVQITPSDTGKTKGRLIVMGNAAFLKDNLARRTPENVAFGLNAVDWVAQDPALIAIRSRDAAPPALAFATPALRDLVKYLNVIGVPVLVALAGFARLVRRRRRVRMPYQPMSSATPAREAA